MYFAVAAPCDGDYFIQIDVKVCFKSELFEWYTFELNYASSSKIIGSMVKPLGLTIDPEGTHIRIEDIEETDHHGSMIWVSRDPKDVLRIAGLDDRIIDAKFNTKEESKSTNTDSTLHVDCTNCRTSLSVFRRLMALSFSSFCRTSCRRKVS